ncbi:MAG: hypothetical protein KDD99_25770 [Bacteroidetes bacterium]|nr:hypothetical protein [Bacteroidota bacterium]
MKNIIFMGLWLLVVQSVFAQYRPMLVEGNRWYCYWEDLGGENVTYIVEGDSVINGVTYQILTGSVDGEPLWPPLFLREDTTERKVFFLKNGTYEFLLYDFSLVPGDTFSVDNFNIVLISISDTIPPPWNNIGGVSISLNNPKVYALSHISTNTINYIWIEGIGSIGDPTRNFDQPFLEFFLLCHFDSAGILSYHDNFYGSNDPVQALSQALIPYQKRSMFYLFTPILPHRISPLK